jgi:hypothetical protein
MNMTSREGTPSEVASSGVLPDELAWDLAVANGALSEIATCWRRAAPVMPTLPVGLPVRLQQAAILLEADARTLTSADPAHRAGLARKAAARIAELRRDVVLARSKTQGASRPVTGDAALWDSVTAALGRADGQLRGIAAEPGRAR